MNVILFMDGSDKTRKDRIEKAACALRDDLEYYYAIYGISVSVRTVYKTSEFNKLMAKRTHIACLVIDDRIEGVKRDPAKLKQKFENKPYIHGMIPVIRDIPAKAYFKAGLYQGIFDEDITGNEVLFDLVVNGRKAEAAATYYKLPLPREVITKDALNTIIKEMVREDIRHIRAITKGYPQSDAFSMYKRVTTEEASHFIKRRDNRIDGRKR